MGWQTDWLYQLVFVRLRIYGNVLETPMSGVMLRHRICVYLSLPKLIGMSFIAEGK